MLKRNIWDYFRSYCKGIDYSSKK